MYYISVNSYETWRTKARELLLRHIAPEDVVWQRQQQQELMMGDDVTHLTRDLRSTTVNIRPDFMDLAKRVACYRDESRWALLYSVAWRLVFENRDLLDDKIDSEMARLWAMHKRVSRDCHKMKAFVRFRKIDHYLESSPQMHPQNCEPPETFVAWFEPEHLILERVAPFFVKRFNSMRWSILTPDACVHWDTATLSYTEGLPRGPRVEDELDALWKQYYASIFNPARLKLKAMQSEMPKKYWVNLPEAPLIAELTKASRARVDGMVREPQRVTWEKTAKSKFVASQQKRLREARDREANTVLAKDIHPGDKR